jgi:hypothetical protein
MQRILEFARLLGRPLKSRKVCVAIATVISAYAAQAGLHVSEEVLVTILSCGVALILGIAHEDSGRRAAPAPERDETASTRPQPMLLPAVAVTRLHEGRGSDCHVPRPGRPVPKSSAIAPPFRHCGLYSQTSSHGNWTGKLRYHTMCAVGIPAHAYSL